jgi:hypothetical protein
MKAKNKRVSAKIGNLMAEGRPQDQAVAIALNYEKEKRLGPRGGVKPKKRK